MNTHRFILEKTSRKTECPSCGKRTFVGFIDQETGELLPGLYGRCDREVNCGYFRNPYQDGYGKTDKAFDFSLETAALQTQRPAAQKVPSFIDPVVLQKSRSRYDQNNFVIWLTRHFGAQTASDLVASYHIGTSRHWPGANIFWQIDPAGKVRTGKVMLYNEQTGKRVKEPYSHITWVHKLLDLPEGFNMEQVYFGAHLLKREPNKPVAVVESEKTAVIASAYLPGFNWLAAGSLTNLTAERCRILSGKNVLLFPDLKCFDRWQEKAKLLEKELPGTQFKVSDYLEKRATEQEKTEGLDLADYLLRYEVGAAGSADTTNVNDRIHEIESEPVGDSTLTVIDIPEVSQPSSGFNLERFIVWSKQIPAKHKPISISPDLTVYNAQSFIRGRINHIQAFKGHREAGNTTIFIHQLQTLQNRISNK